MEITLEISMYPLRENYEKYILQFIDGLEENPNFVVRVNALSTQVQGEQEHVMYAINKGIADLFEKGIKASFVMKILPGGIDLSYNHNA